MTVPDAIKNLIIQKSQENFTRQEIAVMFNVHVRTVYRIISAQKLTKTVNKRNKIKISCLRMVKRGFEAAKRSGKLITAPKVRKYIPTSLSVRSIRRYLRKLDLIYAKQSKKIILSNSQKMKRVEVVRKWICDKLDPDTIIFTDESRFSLDGNDTMYSWKDRNGNIRQMRPYRGGSIMIWGAITKEGQFIYQKINGTLNSEKYCEMIEKTVIPRLNLLNREYIFQQDNASCHVSRFTMALFDRLKIKLLQWPPKSPDLSPIEMLWGILKSKVYDGTNYDNSDQLWTRIVNEIDEMNPATITNLYKNYLNKMCEILCSGGCLLN